MQYRRCSVLGPSSGEMLADNDTEREIGDLIFRSISTTGEPHRPQYKTNMMVGPNI